MKTWKNPAIGLFNGKWFLIQMLVSKVKKLYLVRKWKNPTHLPVVFNIAVVSQTYSEKYLGVSLYSKLTVEERLPNAFKKLTEP